MNRQVKRSMAERDRTDLPIVQQCQLLSISRSSFYATPHGEIDTNLVIIPRSIDSFSTHRFTGFVR